MKNISAKVVYIPIEKINNVDNINGHSVMILMILPHQHPPHQIYSAKDFSGSKLDSK